MCVGGIRQLPCSLASVLFDPYGLQQGAWPLWLRLTVRRGNIPHANKVARDKERRQHFVDFVNASRVSASRGSDRLQKPHFYSGLVPCKLKNSFRRSCHRAVLSLEHMARAPCHLDKPKLGFRTLRLYCQNVAKCSAIAHRSVPGPEGPTHLESVKARLRLQAGSSWICSHVV